MKKITKEKNMRINTLERDSYSNNFTHCACSNAVLMHVTRCANKAARCVYCNLSRCRYKPDKILSTKTTILS